VFDPVTESWQAMAEQYTDEQLTLILGFQNQLEQSMRDRPADLRAGPHYLPAHWRRRLRHRCPALPRGC
jgi:hypothetical protein